MWWKRGAQQSKRMTDVVDTIQRAVMRSGEVVDALKASDYRVDAPGALGVLIAAACLVRRFAQDDPTITKDYFMRAADRSWDIAEILVRNTNRAVEEKRRGRN